MLGQVHQGPQRVAEDRGARGGVCDLPVDGKHATRGGQVAGVGHRHPRSGQEPRGAGVVGEHVGEPEPKPGVPAVDDLGGGRDGVDGSGG